MKERRRHATLAFALAAALAAATTRVRSDDPVSSSVRFTGEIVRIFERKCLACHGSDSLSMPLTTYRDVRAWGRGIREEIVEQRMPPWTVARGYGRFLNDLSLSARETTTVLSWIDGGMPRGDDRDLPAPLPGHALGAPDLLVRLPPQRVPALEDNLVRRVSVPVAVDPARPIARVVFTPGARRVLRGALVFEDTTGDAGRWVGAWLPWQQETAPPAPHSFRLTSGARLGVDLYYRGADQDVIDQSTVAVYYAREPSRAAIDEITIDGSAAVRLGRNATLWAIVPSPGRAAQSLELTARRPDGSVEVLLWIPRVRRDWPQALVLDRARAMPAGTALSLVTHPQDRSAHVRLSLLP
jgi:hypothetical protein